MIVSLRSYIRSVILEKAITPMQARKRDLALHVGLTDQRRMYVLYNPTELYTILQRTKNNDDRFLIDFSSSIIGVVAVYPAKKGRHWSAASISYAAAEKGYGPLMYDIVMASEGGLMADRGSVKPAAKKVWQYYKDSRPDVIAKPLDDIQDPKTEPTIDDAQVYSGGEDNPLNYAYFTKKKPNITQLKSNSANAMKQLRKLEFSVDDLFDIAAEYFDSRY